VLIYYLFLDALLQHLWKYRQKSNCPLKTYQELIHSVKFTSRTWNSKVAIDKILKHITYCLNVDINLLGIKNTRHNHQGHTCEKTHSACYYTFYKFQNVFIKLKFYEETFFDPLIILEYTKKYYILKLSTMNPDLISKTSAPSIAFEDHTISHSTINDILGNRSVYYPFSITVYSAFSYVKNIHSKLAKTLMICETPKQEKNLNLFLTPHIGSPSFDICLLDVTTEVLQPTNLKDMYCNPHITEGNPLPLPVSNKHNKDLLNQDFCVCDHPDTERFTLPTQKSFKSLGMFFVQNSDTHIHYYLTVLFSFRTDAKNLPL